MKSSLRRKNSFRFHPAYREYGWKPSLNDEDRLNSAIYANVTNVGSDVDTRGSRGAVFNLEFSKDGRLLVAACERRCIVSFSALSQKSVFTVEGAHQGYVNCIKFLDSRMFASCSDDNMVAVWDVRNLRQKVHCLKAHSNWVKNIEYLPHRSLLVTSGFDGSIYTWDLNKITGNAAHMQSTRVLHTSGLMRTSLTPDFSKLVVCTNNGFVMVVHDVDFDTMSDDLKGFKPSLYKLMQISRTPFPAASHYTHLFDRNRTRNRIEFITDFPPENAADMITSLAMHPMGWCVASRNTSSEDASEWTCVHDIQDGAPSSVSSSTEASSDVFDGSVPDETAMPGSSESSSGISSAVRELQSLASTMGSIFSVEVGEGSLSSNRATTRSRTDSPVQSVLPLTDHTRPVMQIRFSTSLRSSSSENIPSSDETAFPSGGTTPISAETPPSSGFTTPPASAASGDGRVPQAFSGRSIEVRAPSADVIEALRVIREYRRRLRYLGRRRIVGVDGPTRERFRYVDFRHRIAENVRRLTHYVEEPHSRLTQGFIKELCFSSDGRVLCSPFGYGARLLGFGAAGAEPHWTREPERLFEIATTAGHERAVVTARFSPTDYLLATGCLGGRVVWHQPRF